MVIDFIATHPDATQLIAVAVGMLFFWSVVVQIEANATPRSARKEEE